MKYNRILTLVLILILGIACKREVIPKPKAMLRLDYPEKVDAQLRTPYLSFSYNTVANPIIEGDSALRLDYPKMKGTIYINYKPVHGNLAKLLTDAQKLSYEHTVKAEGIKPAEYSDPTHKVYGMFYQVSGDAASQAQFYATDSVAHFVTGALYFYARPNYDSIFPAATYLQDDMRRIMETIQWQ